MSHADESPDEWERERHRCEVRNMIRRYRDEGADAVRAQLAGIEKHRGKALAERLRQDTWAQMKAGNDGEWGKWL